MRQDTAERFPIIEKTVTLTAEERERFHRAFQISDRVKESILDLLIAAQTKMVDRENAVWQEIAQKFGDKSHEELANDGKIAQVSWATGIVTLRSRGKAEEIGSG